MGIVLGVVLSNSLKKRAPYPKPRSSPDDIMGHLGHSKIVAIVKRNLVWPLLYKYARVYCCLDIVSPVPQGKGGAKFILTVICMATRWPERTP